MSVHFGSVATDEVPLGRSIIGWNLKWDKLDEMVSGPA